MPPASDPTAPLPPFPDGWYFVARSDELRRGSVVTRRLAGRDVVVYRTASGLALASEPHCPHLGAHMGDGRVEGEEIRCPMHGFCFEPGGRCTRTPYGKRPPPKARLGMLPLIERHDLVLVWHSESGGEPRFDIPERGDEGFSRLFTRAWVFRGHPQETTENSVDLGHLTVVHGYRDVEMTSPLRTEGPYLTSSFAFSREVDPLGTLGAIRAFYTTHVHGLGYSFVDVSVPALGLRAHNHVLATPTEAGELTLTVAMRASPIAPVSALGRALERLPGRLGARLVTGLLTDLMSFLAFQGFTADVGADLPMWDRKRYLASPALADGDGPIGPYRKWARQFYPDARVSLPVLEATEAGLAEPARRGAQAPRWWGQACRGRLPARA